MKVELGKYITRKGIHVQITSVTPTKAYGKASGEKAFETWSIEGIHSDPQKTLVRKA